MDRHRYNGIEWDCNTGILQRTSVQLAKGISHVEPSLVLHHPYQVAHMPRLAIKAEGEHPLSSVKGLHGTTHRSTLGLLPEMRVG